MLEMWKDEHRNRGTKYGLYLLKFQSPLPLAVARKEAGRDV